MRKQGIRKGIAVMIAAAIMFSAAGCQRTSAEKTEGEGTASSSVSSENTSETVDEITAETILARDYSEPVTISYAGVAVTEGFDYNHANEYWSWWSDTFNVEWEVTGLTWDNWNERMNTWFAADDLPDWSMWQFRAADAVNYVDQGLVMKAPDDWKEKYPNLAKAAEAVPMNAYYEELLGGMYYFFKPIYSANFPAETITEHSTLYLRKDWAEQAGYDLSSNLESGQMTLSEFLDYCRAVKAAGLTEYPWYNTSIYVGQVVDRTAENAGCQQSAYYKGEDGQYHWGPAEEETGVRNSLRKVKQAYDEGLLYPEFYALTSAGDADKFYGSGEAAAIFYSANVSEYDNIVKEMEKNLGLDFSEAVATFVLTDDEGVEHEKVNPNYFGVNVLSPYIDEVKMDRILTMWDYSCTPEGEHRIYLGEQGIDWDYDENGNLVNLLEGTEDVDVNTKYGTIYPMTGQMFNTGDDFQLINPSYPQEERDRVNELYQIRSDVTNADEKEIDWNLQGYSSMAMNQATFTYWDEYANILVQDGDFDANYDQWVQDRLGLIAPVLEELNQNFGE